MASPTQHKGNHTSSYGKVPLRGDSVCSLVGCLFSNKDPKKGILVPRERKFFLIQTAEGNFSDGSIPRRTLHEPMYSVFTRNLTADTEEAFMCWSLSYLC